MPRYIRINPLKQTLLEDLRIAHSWKVIFLWIFKLTRRRLDFSSPVPISVPFQEFMVEPENVPPQATQKLSGTLAEAAGLGFDPAINQVVRTLSGETVITVANCRHSGGTLFGRFIHSHIGTVHPPRENMSIFLMSGLTDGRRLVTSSKHANYNGPRNVIIQRRIGGSLTELMELHQKKLAELSSSVQPERLANDAQMAVLIDRCEEEAATFQMRRGLYEEVSPAEVEAERSRLTATPPIIGADAADVAVLRAIEKLQNRPGNWKTASRVAFLSLLIFIAAGGARWSWDFVLILAGVVGFHELGHYCVMRMFKYRDLRMFFVPLLGAAVTGRNYNVKGWQRAVVSLAGPVPGIVVGLALMWVGSATHNPLIQKIALVALLVNGINLLPFVPLDGGWVLHAILFSRQYVLESAFLVFAGLALVAATALGHGKLWMYLGILVLVGLPTSHRLARIAGKLRKSGVPTHSPDDQNIPTETALAIFGELKKEQGPTRLIRHLASQTLDVFQKINATPPGVTASTLLLAVYLAALGTGFWGTANLLQLRRAYNESAGFPDLFLKPTRTMDPDGIRLAGTTNEANVEWAAPVVIGTFESREKAMAAFENALSQLSSGDRMTLFGQSVFIGGNKTFTNWLTWFNGRGAQTFVEYPATNLTAFVTLSCQAPDETSASAIEQDCDFYFSAQWVKTWPPWANPEKMEPERKAATESVSYTWKQLQEIDKIVSDNPEYKKLMKSPFSLRRRTTTEIMQEVEKQGETYRNIYQRELDRLTKSDDTRLNKEMIALYGRYRSGTNEDFDAALNARQQNSQLRLGVLPLEGDLPASPDAWRAVSTGSVGRKHANLTFFFVTFYRTDLGLPALANYLQQGGCSQFKYEIQKPAGNDDEP